MNWIKSLLQYMDASTTKGMHYRTWFAVAIALIAIAVDTACVYFLYDQIPQYVPAAFDWNYNVVGWDDKISFWFFEIARIILLLVFTTIGFAITKRYPQSIIAKRTNCLLAETAMLIITTGVGISMAELAIERNIYGTINYVGNEISDYWEFCIMLFWFALLIAEYINDYRKLEKI